MSLVKLIARADERGLAASGLACLDRCLPLLAEESDVLRPLWAGIEAGAEGWPGRLVTARGALDDAIDAEAVTNVEIALVRTLLNSAPSAWAPEPLRVWADTCSLVGLEIHQKFDTGGGAAGEELQARLTRCREEPVDSVAAIPGVGPLVAGELRRQVRILDMLAEPDGTGSGLRQALDLSTEGQRVLRAVVSRRARARS